MADQFNPIHSVGTVTTLPSPSSYQWQESDISGENAGRTADGKMHKMLIGTKVHLNLEWSYVSIADASAILSAFTQTEYFNVNYLDAKSGTYLTKTFYVGDRTVPLYNSRLGLWTNIGFNIIEQ